MTRCWTSRMALKSPMASSVVRHYGCWPHLARPSRLNLPARSFGAHPVRQIKSTTTETGRQSSCCNKKQQDQVIPPGVLSREFWTSRTTWRRSSVNTLRCLVGCTLGDFSAMWYLQAFHPQMGVETVMAISMACGLSTSLLLETVLLRLGRDRLPWLVAAKTAAGMSMISMITMEAAENAVDYHMTGGNIQLDDPAFWLAALLSMAAGYLTPLPYNYHRLRKFGKACH
ncbi:hypothetical protein CDEST_12903 [Colletotrichum destructivum]|uniref:DUF4396 domain-containing protein n=1 Tax=Colletotrichum destructivum TaxID=34406 RepID=A0AAX4IXF3_9PEZI|nr:hypothetical protein CDEST_12903 [Colletotrichum destructivum]